MIQQLVVHCSDTPNDREVTAEDIHQWHKDRGWSGIGYHAVIRRSGEVEQGRPLYWEGAHAWGHNRYSLGVCLVGRDDFTGAQWLALEGLLLAWNAQFPDAEVVGHCDIDISGKTCPNFNVRQWWADLAPHRID